MVSIHILFLRNFTSFMKNILSTVVNLIQNTYYDMAYHFFCKKSHLKFLKEVIARVIFCFHQALIFVSCSVSKRMKLLVRIEQNYSWCLKNQEYVLSAIISMTKNGKHLCVGFLRSRCIRRIFVKKMKYYHFFSKWFWESIHKMVLQVNILILEKKWHMPACEVYMQCLTRTYQLS